MKKQSNTLFAQINEAEFKTITNMVKETLAISLTQKSSKTFSTADLWNIQRQKKSLGQRRYSL